MKEYHVQKCPRCESNEIGKGIFDGYAPMRVVGKIFSSSSVLTDVCSDCGYVIAMTVSNPHKFKVRKDR